MSDPLSTSAYSTAFAAMPAPTQAGLRLPAMEIERMPQGMDSMDRQVSQKVREMYGDAPIVNDVPLTPMHGERLRAQRE